MKIHLSDLRHELATKPWMMEPRRLAALAGRLASMGPSVDLADAREVLAAREEASPRPAIQSAVAVVPVHGMISHRPDVWSWLFGGTPVQSLVALIRQYRDDPAVRAIVLDVDSPGGSVDGVPEAFDELMTVRGVKPMVAVANCLSASAAYYLSAAADEIVVSPSSEIGSIGVYCLYANQQRFWEELGVDIELFRAGERKVEANPWEPLTEDARAELQAGVEYFYDLFTKAVAKGRGVSVSDARSDAFGKGIVFRAKDAVKNGLADRVGTLDFVIQKLAGGGRRGSRAAAAAEADPVPERLVDAAPATQDPPAAEAIAETGVEVRAEGAAATPEPTVEEAAAPVPAARLALERALAIEELA